MAQDILVIINCKSGTVNMYAADPSIVQGNSQGSSELWVRVPASENLRWRVVPLQLGEGAGGAAQLYHTIISKYHLWEANPSAHPAQGEASEYLVNWATNNGAGDTPYYHPPGDLNRDTDAAITTQGINRPFVECTTQLTGRDEEESKRLAYTFYVDIYRDREKVRTINWDPYVTVYRP